MLVFDPATRCSAAAPCRVPGVRPAAAAARHVQGHYDRWMTERQARPRTCSPPLTDRRWHGHAPLAGCRGAGLRLRGRPPGAVCPPSQSLANVQAEPAAAGSGWPHCRRDRCRRAGTCRIAVCARCGPSRTSAVLPRPRQALERPAAARTPDEFIAWLCRSRRRPPHRAHRTWTACPAAEAGAAVRAAVPPGRAEGQDPAGRGHARSSRLLAGQPGGLAAGLDRGERGGAWISRPAPRHRRAAVALLSTPTARSRTWPRQAAGRPSTPGTSGGCAGLGSRAGRDLAVRQHPPALAEGAGQTVGPLAAQHRAAAGGPATAAVRAVDPASASFSPPRRSTSTEPGRVDRPLLERYLADLATDDRRERRSPRPHQAARTPSSPRSASTTGTTPLPGHRDVLPRGLPQAQPNGCPAGLAEHVMAQVEQPANLDRWDNPAYRLITLILMRCGLRVSDATSSPVRTASSATATARPTCATSTTR